MTNRISRPRRAFGMLAVAAGLGIGGAGTALAVGDYDIYTAAPTCSAGEVYDQLLDFCTAAAPGAVNDRMFTDYAYVLARFERYEEAIALLDMVAEKNTPTWYNVKGFATRKMGNVEEGIGYYEKALELDPTHVASREYLGEAYISQGNMDAAKEQLAEIEKLCGNTCREYSMLAEAIKAAS